MTRETVLGAPAPDA